MSDLQNIIQELSHSIYRYLGMKIYLYAMARGWNCNLQAPAIKILKNCLLNKYEMSPCKMTVVNHIDSPSK